MQQVAENSCICNGTLTNRQSSGLKIDHIDWENSNEWTCSGRGSTSYLINCYQSEVESGSSATEIIFSCFCFFLMLLSTFLFFKLRKEKVEYEERIGTLENSKPISTINIANV